MPGNFLIDIAKETIGGYQALSLFGPYVQPAVKLVGAYVVGELAIKFLTDGKQKSATSGINKDLEHLKGTDGFKLTKKLQLSLEASTQGVIVVGSPGQGKTTPFIYTQLLTDHFPKNTSKVINDLKGELWRDTSRYQKSIGNRIFLFEPLGKNGHYNPLDFVETFSQIDKLSVDILTNGALAIRIANGSGGLNSGDATWINMSTPLLTASLLYHKRYAKKHTISAAVKFILNTDAEELEDILNGTKDEQIIEQLNSFNMSVIKDKEGNVAEGGPLTSILTTLTTNTKFWLDPQIVEKTSYSDFGPKMLRDEKVALYIKYFPEDAEYLSPLISIFYSQLIERCKKYDGVDKNSIIWLLDEAQNLGKISSLPKTLNTCREPRFAFMLVVQSVASLHDLYGRSGTKAILSALQTKCILPGCSDVEFLRELTTLSGDEEISIKQDKRDVKMKKNVFTPDEIRRLKVDEVLILTQNLKPIKAKQHNYFDNDEMILNKYM